MNKIRKRVKEAIRSAYAWPGGYPLAIVMADGELMCPGCARGNYNLIADRFVSPKGGSDIEQWRAVGIEALYEDAEEDPAKCCHCGKAVDKAKRTET
jgi:hypothetical protein